VKELISESDEVVSDKNEIIDEEFRYYSKLYSCVNTNNCDIDELLSCVDTKLSDDNVNMCDGDINGDEDLLAVKQMSLNKSPGCDGLTFLVVTDLHSWL